MNTKVCKVCQKEKVSTKFTGLNLGDNCIAFYGIKNIAIPARQNLSSQSTPSSGGKFISMTHGLAMDPKVSLSLIEKTYKNDINQVLSAFPYLNNRSTLDTLTAAEMDKISSYPNFIKARQAALHLVHVLHNNFKLFLEDKLHEGLTLAEAQIAGIKEYLKLPEYQSLSFNEIYTQGEVTQDQVNRVINSFQAVSTLIPDVYKNNTPVPTIIIRGENGQNSAPFASAAEKSLIVLNLQKNLITQISEALHEYLHLIEQFNPMINKATNEFLLKNAISLNQKTLQDIGLEFKKPFKQSAGEVLVYEGPFVDPYVGRTYGILDKDLNKLVTTEVLSVGGEALLLNPTTFSLRDPEHFELIKKVLLAQY